MYGVEKRRSDVQGLPPGWKREESIRKSGLSAGKTDVYYLSPSGDKIRSKPQLVRSLGENFDLSCFDFRTGKILQSAIRKSKRHTAGSYDYARGIRHDANLVLPIRQTASIFKQPVTVVRNRPESRTKSDLKHGPQEQPKQLFWEKRLHGLQACDITEEKFKSLDLPNNIQGVGPELSTENMLQSIAAALHLNSQPITGQHASKAVVVTENDIQKQEVKVTEARKKLEQAISSLID
ncbi:hypothetical protein LSH36_401g02003 [Paralvinella palmiformis]|uniref:MBD domain-containing protein n=1 Tax=Paralvinella palmiformis TaxID=53620 RepID=A0AAD9JCP0_9ANNE|nr:hypothetical protein LSH36_401g02003 [Paralvinella palmiformis]